MFASKARCSSKRAVRTGGWSLMDFGKRPDK
jgi:hypothetical protein